MLVFSMTTTQIHYSKANICKENKTDKDVPFSAGGSGPSATCGTGILSSITGRLGTTALPRCMGILCCYFPLR